MLFLVIFISIYVILHMQDRYRITKYTDSLFVVAALPLILMCIRRPQQIQMMVRALQSSTTDA